MTRPRLPRLVLAAFAVTFVALRLAHADPARFAVLGHGQSTARFRNEAPLETMTGNTDAVSGEVTFDRANPAATRGRIAVDLGRLRTGIDMRDEHLRGAQWLDTARFPQAVFEITGVAFDGAVADNRPLEGQVRGRLTIHGIAIDATASVTATYVPLTPAAHNDALGITADALRVRARFRTRFTNHGMQVPRMLLYKVSNDIDVEVNLTLVAQPARPPG